MAGSIKKAISHAKRSSDAKILYGGGCSERKGYFIEPTVIQARRPDFKLMREEIFGPVLTIYVYQDASLDKALDLCDKGSPYALTGAIFARQHGAVAAPAVNLRRSFSAEAASASAGATTSLTVRDALNSALDEELARDLPLGGAGTAAIYTKALGPFHLISKVTIRMKMWMNYLPI